VATAFSDFQIGNRVVHPRHGAGVVKSIEAKRIGETSHRYYVIDTQNMEVMVPVKRAQSMGIRPIHQLASLREMLCQCCHPPKTKEVDCDHRARKASLDEELKDGSFQSAVHAARVLYFIRSQRPLGTVDTRLYRRALSMICSELSLATSQELSQVEAEVESRLSRMLATSSD